jgi:DNA-directed RNA polymerase subunit E'/Rpb7
MLHTKLIDATIGVRNPISFCTDKKRHALIYLKNTYEGKCFKGGFIASIDAIPKISDCRIVSTNHSAEGYIDVQFSAKVAVLARWDVIPGVKIVRSEQLIIGSTPGRDKETYFDDPRDAKVVVTLLPTPEAKTIRVGQLVCVRVVNAEHAPMQQHASAVGTLLTCERSSPVYRVRGTLDPAGAAELMPVVDAIDREMQERQRLYETRRADMMFFEVLLYSYSRGKEGLQAAEDDAHIESAMGSVAWIGPPEAKTDAATTYVNIIDLVKKAAAGEAQPMDGLWSRPLTMYRSCPLVSRVARKSSASAVDETPPVAVQVFLKSILEFLFAVRSMVETYNSKALIDSHVNLWIAMRKSQLSQ